jgi:chromosomal replication initiator protein
MAPASRLATRSMQSAHARFEALLREAIGAERYAGSFQNKALFRLDEGRLEVAAPNKILAGLLERRFGDAVRQVATADAPGTEVVFTVAPDLFGPGAEKIEDQARRSLEQQLASVQAPMVVSGASGTANEPPRQLKAQPKHVVRAQVQERYRLEHFIVGDSNRLAFNAAIQMAESGAGASSATGLRALFLHGPCGVGKTHLLNGVAIRYKERNPGATVRVTNAEAFMNEYIAGVRAGDVEKFRRVYRRVDLLCIDDVHFLSNKQSTQAELLHTLDEIERCGARIVLASDEHPRQIRQFSAALVSRFMAGMVAVVQPPDANLRRAVAQTFAKARGLTLDTSALDELVERTAIGMAGPGRGVISVRDIEGLVTKIDALHRLAPEYAAATAETSPTSAGAVGVLSIERALGHTAVSGLGDAGRSTRPVRIDAIIAETCTALAIDPRDLSGKTRHKRVVAARALITHLARHLTTMSFPEIARAIGRPNHSTVITAFQRLQKQMEAEEPVEAPGAPEARTLGALARQLMNAVQSGRGRAAV